MFNEENSFDGDSGVSVNDEGRVLEMRYQQRDDGKELFFRQLRLKFRQFSFIYATS